jgi:hypothetical protein
MILIHNPFLTCDIKGCYRFALNYSAYAVRWKTIRAEEWPNLDWFAYGGIDHVTLCPKHAEEVASEILKLRLADPSMNPEGPTPDNHS